jgi:hypothetical protein
MPNYRATSEGNIPFTAEEEAEWAAEQAAWAAGADSRKAAEVRSERSAKLAATDWTQITDATADKALWATYRQALRDITAQSGFPNNVVWPDAP